MSLDWLMSNMLMASGGLAIGIVLLALLGLELRDEGRGSSVLRSGSRSTAKGVRGLFSLTRALGFAAFVVIETFIAELFGVGVSLFEVLGPLVASNLFAIGIGSLGFAGIIPVDPYWYAGVMLMIFGIAISSAGEAVFERYRG